MLDEFERAVSQDIVVYFMILRILYIWEYVNGMNMNDHSKRMSIKMHNDWLFHFEFSQSKSCYFYFLELKNTLREFLYFAYIENFVKNHNCEFIVYKWSCWIYKPFFVIILYFFPNKSSLCDLPIWFIPFLKNLY